MTSATAQNSHTAPDGDSVPDRTRQRWILIGGVLLVAVLVLVILFQQNWPFTPDGVRRRLQQHSSATVQFGSFHELFVPRPGFVAENVVLRATPNSAPILTIRKLTVLASYSGLIAPVKRISRVQADGLVVFVSSDNPLSGLNLHRSTRKSNDLILDDLVADGSRVEVTTHTGEKLLFPVRWLHVNDLGEHSSTQLYIALQLPTPSMQPAVTAQIGPWRADKLFLTPTSGAFHIENGLLGTLPGIAGTLTSSGQFKGTLGHFHVSGRAEIADFQTKSAKHPMPLRVSFDSDVNSEQSQMGLESVDATLGKTSIQGTGSIFFSQQAHPDVVDLTLTCNNGRVDDLLTLFVSSPKPSMSGPIRFHTAAAVERGQKPFLERVVLKGSFTIHDAQFNSSQTQRKLNNLSARSEGNPGEQAPPDRAVSTLSGDVDLEDGTASLSDVLFRVAGAEANGGGTFNIIDSTVDLKGKLRMQAELSQATKGVKSFFLKLLDPFFKKRNAGAEVPVYITGTSKKPKFKVGLK